MNGEVKDERESAKIRRAREERGQTLVEYALIIAVVSLGSLAALGFLSGKIQGLFSKAGSSIQTVAVGGPTTPSTPSFTPPGNGTGSGNGVNGAGQSVSGTSGSFYEAGALTAYYGVGPNLRGIYDTDEDNHDAGTTLTYSFGTGNTFTCTWYSIPNSPASGLPSELDPHWGTQEYDWVCAQSAPTTPTLFNGQLIGSAGYWFYAGVVVGQNNAGTDWPDGKAGLYRDSDPGAANCNNTALPNGGTHSGTWFNSNGPGGSDDGDFDVPDYHTYDRGCYVP